MRNPNELLDHQTELEVLLYRKFSITSYFFSLVCTQTSTIYVNFPFFPDSIEIPPPHQHPPRGIPLNSVLELYLVPNALSYPNYEMGLFHILVLFSKYSSFAPIICMYAYNFICNRTDETYQLDYREMRDLCFYSMICKLHQFKLQQLNWVCFAELCSHFWSKMNVAGSDSPRFQVFNVVA